MITIIDFKEAVIEIAEHKLSRILQQKKLDPDSIEAIDEYEILLLRYDNYEIGVVEEIYNDLFALAPDEIFIVEHSLFSYPHESPHTRNPPIVLVPLCPLAE